MRLIFLTCTFFAVFAACGLAAAQDAAPTAPGPAPEAAPPAAAPPEAAPAAPAPVGEYMPDQARPVAVPGSSYPTSICTTPKGSCVAPPSHVGDACYCPVPTADGSSNYAAGTISG
jgi:hypothetical protein